MGLIRLIDSYCYYNQTDGTDIAGKLIGTLKLTLPGTFVVGFSEILRHDLRHFYTCANCMAGHMIPINAMAISFCALTYLSAKLRKDHGVVNYFWGALGPALVTHAQFRSFRTSGLVYMSVVILGATCKGIVEESSTMYGLKPLREVIRYDFESLQKYRFAPKNDPRPWKNQSFE